MESTDTQQNERHRILDMVQAGKVSPEEADRLLASLEQRSHPRQRCPYCAEEIPGSATVCPECRSPLRTQHATGQPRGGGRGFASLTGLGKFLVCYVFLICGLVWVLSLGHFGPGVIPGLLLALVGIVAGIQICKGSEAGWVLGALWAGVQILPIVIGGGVLNRQLLHVGMVWTTNGNGIGINFVGIVLLILFLRAKPRTADQPQKRRI